MANRYASFLGSFRYEFLMQIRRRALWITFSIVFTLFGLFFAMSDFLKDIPTFLTHNSLTTVLVFWSFYINTYMPICVGILLADRLPRDRKHNIDELLMTLPASLEARLLGKYLGSMFATLTPLFLFYISGVCYILCISGNPLTFLLGMLTFLLIIMPGSIFISSFSLDCPAFMKVPAYQFLFIGYWVWGNIFWFRSELFTLGRTLISPIGIYITFGIFGGAGFDTKGIHATFWQGIASILILLGIALLVIVALTRYLKWQKTRL
ncbi:hypothetical protein EPA93_23190 [Ktedonosporobacter rubrisoli]|uniref:Uncharacterized protein n=1 Tax=Ktedonosporobacter rubrisoli TaxID=2509675 RepID=A0A4P6JT34_KTERU|nr:hypothetical protein [Ktedonosporobacter rubrisoli]QBD78729.1 hypothetical protein EPA93_23190 [Ktedonosporobacter rubrisoli]